jgi:hypothetical protein
MIATRTYKYRLILVEDMLGSAPKSNEVYSTYIAQRALKRKRERGDVDTPDEEILAESEDVEEGQRGETGFLRDEQGPYILDYVVRGFLKSASETLEPEIPGKRKSSVRLNRSIIDRYVFVYPRKLHFWRDGAIVSQPDGVLERPLRAMTMQGPRVSLVRSEVIHKGAYLDVEIRVIDTRQIPQDILEYLLEYGEYQGLGQWRNGSWGRFVFQRIA